MFKFTVRSASYYDFHTIYKLSTEQLGSSMSLEKMKLVYDHIMSCGDQAVILAIHSNHAAGYIHVRTDHDLLTSSSAHIYSYAYFEYYKDKGILNYLFGAAEKWSVQMDVQYINIVLRPEFLKDKDFLLKNQYIQNSESPLFEKRL